MKTRDELVLDFMLAIASNIFVEDLDFTKNDEDVADVFADITLVTAQALTRKYLESL